MEVIIINKKFFVFLLIISLFGIFLVVKKFYNYSIEGIKENPTLNTWYHNSHH